MHDVRYPEFQSRRERDLSKENGTKIEAEIEEFLASSILLWFSSCPCL